MAAFLSGVHVLVRGHTAGIKTSKWIWKWVINTFNRCVDYAALDQMYRKGDGVF